MKIEEAIQAMREGKKVRHESWKDNFYAFKIEENLVRNSFYEGEEELYNPAYLYGDEIFDDGWEIFEEKERVEE